MYSYERSKLNTEFYGKDTYAQQMGHGSSSNIEHPTETHNVKNTCWVGGLASVSTCVKTRLRQQSYEDNQEGLCDCPVLTTFSILWNDDGDAHS